MQPKSLGDDGAGRVAQYNEAAKGPQARFNAATDQYLEAIEKIEKDYPEAPAADDKLEKPSDTAELQLSLQVLSRQTGLKTAALYTLIGEKYFYTVLITPDSIKSFSVPIAAEALNHKVINLFSLLQSADYDPRLQSKELYDIILKPVEAELKTANIQTLMWSLDGALRYIPMAALYDGQQYLVERFNHVVLTRAEKGRLTRAVNAHWTGYGFATSAPHKVEVGGQPITFGPIDFAEDEMQIFRTTDRPKGLIDGEIFPEAKFNKAALLAALKQKRPLVHISSHFRFRPGDEANSFLLLGDGTVMTLTEMKGHLDLFQGVELLTLSACDTAAQRPDATGKEIDTLAELAQRLGAGSVLASLWAVRDRSTAQLMKAFYKNREGGKATKAEALRKAQLDLLHGNGSNLATVVNRGSEKSLRGSSRSEDIIVEAKYRVPFKPEKSRPFAHPYYWSPFVLFGNWR
jgi:CHAT domain-containing protein